MEGYFDPIWNNSFSRLRPMKRAREFEGKVVRFEKAIFQPAGYASPLLSHLVEFDRNNPMMCSKKLKTIIGYAESIMKGFGITERPKTNERIKVLFISRRPYVKSGVQHSFMGRQIDNEDEVLGALQNYVSTGEIHLERIDFAHLTFAQQIEKVHVSDFLIGMHGAGLTHSFWLPSEQSAVLELFPHNEGSNWKLFEQITLWKGNLFEIWTNSYPYMFRNDEFGDYLNVTVPEFLSSFEKVLRKLQQQRGIRIP